MSPRSLFAPLWGSAALLLTLTALQWGGNAVASRASVGEVGPLTLTSLRWVGVCAIMLPIMGGAVWAHRATLLPLWPKLILTSFLGYTAFNTLMYTAAQYTSAINIGILQGSIPVFVLLGALALHGTRIGRWQVVGVAVTIVGVLLVASRGDPGRLAALEFNIGDLWMIAACGFYAMYTVLLRDRPGVPGLVFFTTLATIALFISLPAMLWEIATAPVSLPTPKGWALVAFVCVFPSLLSQILFMRGVELIGPGRAGVYVNLVPVFAAGLAVALLGEPFGWYHAGALALVLGGIAIAERGKRPA